MDREQPVSVTPPDLKARATSKAAGLPGVKHVIAVAKELGLTKPAKASKK